MNRFKGIALSAAGFIMSLVYLVGIVGLDIHIDHHGDRIYVVSLLSDTSCESIHPDDVCNCCEHHHHHDDCQDISCFLQITGDGLDASTPDLAPSSIPAVFEAALPFSETFSSQCVRLQHRLHFSPPPRERLSSICVLRV